MWSSSRSSVLSSLLLTMAGGCSDPPPADPSGTEGTATPTNTDGVDGTAGTCAEPLLTCADECIDPAHDPDHCGGCDQPCSPGMACAQGSCTVACGPDLVVCDEACVDPLHDPDHCGGCDLPCAPEAACQAGTCVASCAAPQVGCAGLCRSITNDEQHCGACDVPCPAGQPCVAGQCVATSLHHVLITGQSLSVGAVSEVVSIQQPFDNVSFVTGVRAGGSGLDALIPLVETFQGNEGETLASGMANLLTARAMATGGGHRSLVSAHGVGGVPYTSLRKGTAAYANGMAQVTAGSMLAQARGETYAVRAVVVVHGETDHINGNANYDLDLLEWQSDYEADIAAMTGQTLPVPLITDQMSSFTTLGPGTPGSPIAQAQLEASRAEPDRVVLMGPKYMLPYVPDGVHLTGDGERWLGEMHAKVFERVLVQGEPWRPVSPRSVVRDGAEITIQMWVPAPPLVLDDITVSDPGNYGFGYTDSSDAPPSIVSVALVGEDSVRVTLSRTPVGGNQRIRYAMDGVPGQPAGPMTGARGNLRDSDTSMSRHGYPLFDWCVHFDEPIP